MQKSSQMAYDYAMQKNVDDNNQKVVERLKLITPTYTSESWLDDLLVVTKQVVKLGGSLYGKTS